MTARSPRHFSLTGRIIVTVLTAQLVLTAALTLMAVLYARYELRSAFDATLRGRATATLALVRYDEGAPPGLLFDASLLPASSDLVRRDLFEIRGPEGQLIARTGGPAAIPAQVVNGSAELADFALRGRGLPGGCPAQRGRAR